MSTSGHTRAPFRAERALTAGLLCGPGGAAAHVLAGGASPTPTALLLVTGAAVLGAALATARRLGPVALLVLAGGAQAVFHHVFGAAPATSGHAMSMGHPMGSSPDGISGEVVMLLAHVAVSVLVVLVASGVEASWWALARSVLVRLLPGLPAAPAVAPVVATRPRVPARRTTVPVTAEEPDVVGPRGPPPVRALAASPS